MQERLFDQSDAYRVHVCDRCGLFAVANLKKNHFHCPACKNTTGIVQVPALSSAHCCREHGIFRVNSHASLMLKCPASELL